MSPKIYKSTVPPVPVIRHSIFTYLFRHTNTYPPTAPAFIDEADDERLTRGQVMDLALRLAWGLRQDVLLPEVSNHSKLGNLERGDTVLIMSPNTLSWPIMLFGCVAAGLRISFASSSATHRELSWQWTDSNARMIIVTSALVQVARDMFKLVGIPEDEAEQRIWVVDRLWDMGAPKYEGYNWLGDLLNRGIMAEEEIFDGNDADETVYICYSSGTTGRPKGVETSHKNVATVLGATQAIWGQIETDRDVLLGLTPVYHMFGLAMSLHYPLFAGKPLVMMNNGFEAETFCRTVERYKITTVTLVPPIMLTLSTHPAVDKYDLRSLTNLASGAAPLSPALASKVLDRLNAQGANVVLLQGCGSTETTCPAQIVAPKDSVVKFGSIGQLVPNVEARLMDDSDDPRDVEDGLPGEMWLRGPTIMKGYLNNKVANEASFTPDGWFKTGDILRRDKDGYYYIVDRKKEMLKYKAFAPAELEAVLMENPEVADVGVIGVMNEYTGDELPRAYVAPTDLSILKSPFAKIVYESRVQKWVEGRVAHYKYLRGGVVVVESIPKSGTGKILRKDLRERAKIEVKRSSKGLSARL